MEIQSLKSELIWVNSKKTNLMEELKQFQKQSLDASQKLLNSIILLQSNNAELSAQLLAERQSNRQNQNTLEIKLRGLEELMNKKEKENENLLCKINDLASMNETLLDEVSQLKSENHKYQLSIKELNSSLEATQVQYEDRVKTLTAQNDQNIQSMITKYEALIQNKVSTIAEEYQRQLGQLQVKNSQIIKELEEQLKEKMEKNQLSMRKNQSDHERVIEENRKLLASLNQHKKKVLYLETENNTQAQEMKLALREKDLAKANLKRQLDSVKEDKKGLEDKIKVLREQIQERKWECRQLVIDQQQQFKKVSQKHETIVEQLLKENRLRQQENKQQFSLLKEQKDLMTVKYEKLKSQNESLKEVVKYFKKQKQEYLTETKKSIQLPVSQKHDDEESQLVRYKNLCTELKREGVRKNAEIEVLREELARLKTKANRVTTAYQEHLKAQQLMEKENKMLLSEIIFLRDKNKSKMRKAEREQSQSQILDLKSQQSEIMENQDIGMYKQLIMEMEKDMLEAAAKIQEKNIIIQKQKSIIERLERALNS